MNIHGHGVELLEGADPLQQDNHRTTTLHSLCTQVNKVCRYDQRNNNYVQ